MKNYKLKAEEILEIEPNRGACFATDKITVDGQKIGYMYREIPTRDIDSGWRFFQETKPMPMLITIITFLFMT